MVQQANRVAASHPFGVQPASWMHKRGLETRATEALLRVMGLGDTLIKVMGMPLSQRRVMRQLPSVA